VMCQLTNDSFRPSIILHMFVKWSLREFASRRTRDWQRYYSIGSLVETCSRWRLD
jgi:hypothetical protein